MNTKSTCPCCRIFSLFVFDEPQKKIFYNSVLKVHFKHVQTCSNKYIYIRDIYVEVFLYFIKINKTNCAFFFHGNDELY